MQLLERILILPGLAAGLQDPGDECGAQGGRYDLHCGQRHPGQGLPCHTLGFTFGLFSLWIQLQCIWIRIQGHVINFERKN